MGHGALEMEGRGEELPIPNAQSPIPNSKNLYPSIKRNRLTIRYIYGVVD